MPKDRLKEQRNVTQCEIEKRCLVNTVCVTNPKKVLKWQHVGGCSECCWLRNKKKRNDPPLKGKPKGA